MTYRFKSLLTAAIFSLSLWGCAIYGGMTMLPGIGQDVDTVRTAAVE